MRGSSFFGALRRVNAYLPMRVGEVAKVGDRTGHAGDHAAENFQVLSHIFGEGMPLVFGFDRTGGDGFAEME